MRGKVLLALLVVGLVGIGAAAAGLNRNWSDHADGSQEVPARPSQGQGQAIFHLAKDGQSIDYKLIASNIDNVFMSHIHRQVPGQNGPIVVWLYPSTAVQPGPLGAGRTDGVLVEGTITAANIAASAPAGYTFAQLVADMHGGNAYVNFHTNDGVGATNTGPGDFPGGEIRADLTP